MSKKIFALFTLGTILVILTGSSIMNWMHNWPLWLLWGILIGLGNAVYTTVKRNNEIETISLMMSMILLALLNLSWPAIAGATILGVGLGEIFRHKQWYKKLYSTTVITMAAVLTEIIYTYTSVNTIMMTALVMDVIMFTLYAPIWLLVAGQKPKEVRDSYWVSFWTVPVSAVIAITINEVSNYDYGIAWVAVGLILILRPRYEIIIRIPKRQEI